ncbi:hypothetical protein OG226_41775 [Streptomyces sp. NBC_01261]|uniref:hypothetical protein n=1 Tax=Streptomyces sp. NBC_01261 TaxID=2903802 RepID=UPI002E37FD9A|nr:hypothetical protein [Streptomyces sp. NBC_01261]
MSRSAFRQLGQDGKAGDMHGRPLGRSHALLEGLDSAALHAVCGSAVHGDGTHQQRCQ